MPFQKLNVRKCPYTLANAKKHFLTLQTCFCYIRNILFCQKISDILEEPSVPNMNPPQQGLLSPQTLLGLSVLAFLCLQLPSPVLMQPIAQNT